MHFVQCILYTSIQGNMLQRFLLRAKSFLNKKIRQELPFFIRSFKLWTVERCGPRRRPSGNGRNNKVLSKSSVNFTKDGMRQSSMEIQYLKM